MAAGRDYFRRFLLAVCFVVYALPFLVSLTLPFAYWDWLMVPIYQLRNLAYAWSDLPGNVFFTFFHDPIQFRPVSTVIVNVEYLLFGGEFWVWYIVKWAVFAGSVGLMYACVRNFTASRWAALVAAIYIGLHPEPFVLDLMSQDGYVVLFGLAALWWLSSRQPDPIHPLRYLTWMTNRDFAVFFGLCMFAAFSKEVGVTFLGALFVFFILSGNIQPSRRVIFRYALFVALLAFCLVRIGSVRYPNEHIGLLWHGKLGEFFGFIWGQWKHAFSYLLPNSVLGSLKIVTLILGFGGAAAAALWRRNMLPLIIAAAAGVIASLFIISTAYPCPKYMPVPVMFLGLLLGAATGALAGTLERWVGVVAAAFVALMCLSAPAKIYSSWLGMTQSLYELSDIIHFMEIKHDEGYALRWTNLANAHEIPHETGATLKEFFEHDSVRWYGYAKPIAFTSLQTKGPPADHRYVLLSDLTPTMIAHGILAKFGVPDLHNLAGVYTFARVRYGVLETITGWLKRLDRTLGVSLRDPIDCQEPQPSRFSPGMPNPMHAVGYFPLIDGPHQLYVFDPKKAITTPAADIVPTSVPPLRRYGAINR